ncbi:hypothetical protein [Pararhizobium gei]|uniref:hypothetical protein n=1 Tax=Pararhizobium gei TaxID=1395951 RepID=UPI0023DC9AC4|nr:hypothetical protein [Rhizobium gei]
MEFYSWLIAAGGLVGALSSFFRETLGLQPVPLLIALLTPALLLYGRHEVRLNRLRAIQEFLLSFGSKAEAQMATSKDDKGAGEQNAAAKPDANLQQSPQRDKDVRLSSNPSFEFVKSKYTSDIRVEDPKDGRKYTELNHVEQIDRIIDTIGPFGAGRDRKMFLSSLGLILLSYFGFSALQDTLTCGFGMQSCPAAVGRDAYAVQLVVIGSLAFAGAYVAAIRTFVRAVAVFDLSPYTFLRHTAEIVASVIFTIFLFAAFRDPVATFTGQSAAEQQNANIPVIWYGLAPLLGLLPQSATKFAMVKFQSLINWIKTTDDRFIEVTKITSPDIIDGIDYETRFRLEECGIYDVQNLATYNPIMLHIESPYGIYQTIDWVAQAQLCHILGPEKFMIFRELNIRTIFDLERAIGSEHSPKEFDEICAGILFASTSNLRKTLDISKISPMVFEDGQAKQVTGDAFCLWARSRIQSDDPSEAAEHVLRWIADDLHVRRLRRIWLDISASLGPDAERLPDTVLPKPRPVPLPVPIQANANIG